MQHCSDIRINDRNLYKTEEQFNTCQIKIIALNYYISASRVNKEKKMNDRVIPHEMEMYLTLYNGCEKFQNKIQSTLCIYNVFQHVGVYFN